MEKSTSKSTSIEMLRQISVFNFLTTPMLDKLASISLVKQYSKGNIIFNDGEKGLGFYGILNGKVKIFKININGKEHVLHILGKGDIFAEVVLSKEDITYPASAMSISNSTLIFFPRDRIKDLINNSPEFTMGLFSLFTMRLRELVKKIEDLSLREVPARLATYLILISKNQGMDYISLDISKTDLALYLGATPETLSRSIKKLKELQLIKVHGNRIEILDLQGLSHVALGILKERA